MNGYDEDTGRAFYRRLLQRVEGMPGVEGVALASWLPLGQLGCKGHYVTADGYERPLGEDKTYTFAIVSPGYFSTLRIPLLSGRDFTDADDARAAKVAIVNETFARRFWPGKDPIGRQFRTEGVPCTVVGVAKTGKYNQLSEAPGCFFYLPYLQGFPTWT